MKKEIKKVVTSLVALTLCMIMVIPTQVIADTATSGDVSSGDVSSGDVSSGDVSSGDVSSGDISSDDVSSDDVSSGDVASGDVVGDENDDVTTDNEDIPSKITTNTIKVKVGDMIELRSDFINKYLPNEYVINGGVTNKMWDTSLLKSYDENYLIDVKLFYYITMDEEEKSGYVTPEELPALREQYTNDNGVEFVYYVGVYFPKVTKVGNTTIVIEDYPITSDISVELTIPIVIEEIPNTGDDDDNNDDDNNDDDNNNNNDDDTIVSVTDENIVLEDANDVLPKGTTMTSEKLTSGTIFDNAKEVIEKALDVEEFIVYELNLLDTSNVEIHELDNKVKVTLDAPFEVAQGKTIKVYRVDNVKLIECPTTFANGKVTFETNHFSTYIFAEVDIDATAPDTGDGSLFGLCAILMLGSALLIVGLAKKRKVA